MIGTVAASRLNVRDRPSPDGRRLGALTAGTVVDILGRRNGWFEIRFDESPGFLYGDYVRVVEHHPLQTGVVNAHLLNVRDRPTTTAAIIGRLSRGSTVEISSLHAGSSRTVENGRGDAWLEISFQDGLAFVSRDYVEVHEVDSPKTGTVTARLLNVRSQPRSGAQIIGQLPRSSRVAVLNTLGSWHEIPFNSTTGFVSGTYVNLASADSRPAPIALNTVEEEEEEDRSPIAVAEEPPSPLIPSRQLPALGTPPERKVASTWNRFGRLLEDLSDRNEIDVACAVAVLCVESSGKGFEPANQNRLIIRFENHKFWKYWGRSDPERFRRHFRYRKGQAWKDHDWRRREEEDWKRFHGNQRSEWEVLEFARTIDDEAALTSISMGAPQIMGFHFHALGYQSVVEMFQAFAAGMEAQIRGLFDFMSPAMVLHLQDLNFSEFAGLYNGSGQKETYGRWIDDHYRAFKRLA